MKTIDFIEIGTSSFNTLLQEAKVGETGLSIEPVSHYLSKLPNKDGIEKIKCAVTSNRQSDFIEVFYIPEEIIVENNLPTWFRGCNRIGDFHPLHIKHGVSNMVKVESVPLKNFEEIMDENSIYKANEIKIDTEGHDCIIMKGIFNFFKDKGVERYPRIIQFETNENSLREDVDEVIELFKSIGFTVKSRGYDTILEIK